MSTFRLHAKRLFTGQAFLNDQVLSIESGKITAIDSDITNVDQVAEGLVVPGFIDLQVNGGGGALLNDSPSVEKIKTIIEAHSKFGTTGMMPTLVTDTAEVMMQAADAIAQAIAEGVPGILGVHFEGPFLSVAKKGTHCEEYIRAISDAEWAVLSRKDMGEVIVTLAPENVSSEDVARMVALGIKVCIGHTNADFETAQKAIDAGADGFTHLYNAMSPLEGRSPGVVGAAFLNDHTACGLIVDGHHVDYTSCKIAIETKPKGKVILVTDAMPPVGTDDTEFAFFDRTVYLNDGKLTSTTGELAGAVLDMATAVRNTHKKVGVELGEAIRMASQYAADYLNQGGQVAGKALRGSLVIGAQADFVVLNDDLETQSTWISGETVYSK
jgi:N-acetylglucosamine-6-phosphate deacetylase